MRILTTIRRLALLLFVFLLWAPAAYAWSWPVQGPVLQPFAYDESHPYAAGQHRGVDIGASAAGETVVAPAAGTISFAGTVPTNGNSVTIETADGYSVTLTHLGSIAVAKGATVAEQQAVGTIGPSGTPEVDGPYVHLGIRHSADPNGYVDPLSLLPPAPDSGTTETGSTGTQPSTSGAASAPSTKKKPAARVPAAPTVAAGHATATRSGRDLSSHERGRTRIPQSDARPRQSARRPTVRDARTPAEPRAPRSVPREGTGFVRRPLEEPVGLGAGRRLAPVAQARPEAHSLSGLVCNWAAALFALGAALAASRRRRRGRAVPATGAPVFPLEPPARAHRPVSRAA